MAEGLLLEGSRWDPPAREATSSDDPRVRVSRALHRNRRLELPHASVGRPPSPDRTSAREWASSSTTVGSPSGPQRDCYWPREMRHASPAVPHPLRVRTIVVNTYARSSRLHKNFPLRVDADPRDVLETAPRNPHSELEQELGPRVVKNLDAAHSWESSRRPIVRTTRDKTEVKPNCPGPAPFLPPAQVRPVAWKDAIRFAVLVADDTLTSRGRMASPRRGAQDVGATRFSSSPWPFEVNLMQ
jgi:hypothetical protein